MFRHRHKMLERIERRGEEKRIDPPEPDREIPNRDEDRDGRKADREREVFALTRAHPLTQRRSNWPTT